jgi:hypothetical protein
MSQIIVQLVARRVGDPTRDVFVSGTLIDTDNMPDLVLLDHFGKVVEELAHNAAEHLGITVDFEPLIAEAVGPQAQRE